MKKVTVALMVLFGLIVLPVWSANATPIDLKNNFYIIPDDYGQVTFSPDGYTAVINEDPFESLVGISNDPYLDDPVIITPGPGMEMLIFDYSFIEGSTDNNDEFGAFVFDPWGTFNPEGSNLGPEFDFFLQDSESDSHEFDLSAFSGQVLGLQFQLAALPGDLGIDSTVTVSNVRLTSAAAPVPEPATVILFGTGLFGLLGLGRRKLRI